MVHHFETVGLGDLPLTLLDSGVDELLDLAANHAGMGRELFGAFRRQVSGAETGATIFGRE